ncbi:hypothetical protein FSP39_023464 [Pinctada imbricata]|uniref:Small ribosomal subunit protein bS16m n=1 Tax=Pinctada imbricata TaxID=66713 RepID=A0AA88Y6H4_PINIB|nr:hypothetical protein FSP39_023464 [Pinctada imbricata]
MGRGPFNSSKKMIRLALHGCTNRPFYHVVLMWNRAPRDGRPLENLGYYDPMSNIHWRESAGIKV